MQLSIYHYKEFQDFKQRVNGDTVQLKKIPAL